MSGELCRKTSRRTEPLNFSLAGSTSLQASLCTRAASSALCLIGRRWVRLQRLWRLVESTSIVVVVQAVRFFLAVNLTFRLPST